MLFQLIKVGKARAMIDLLFPGALRTFSTQVREWTVTNHVSLDQVFSYENFNYTTWLFYFCLQNIGLTLHSIGRVMPYLAARCGVELYSALNADSSYKDFESKELVYRNLLGHMEQTFILYDDAFNKGKVRSFNEKRFDFIQPQAHLFIARYALNKRL